MKNKKINNTKNSLEIYRKVLLGILTILIFYPPFARGLFFTQELTIYHIQSFTLLVLLIIYKALIKDYKFLKSPIDYISLGLVIIYLLPIMFSQYASMSGAIGELLKYANYFVIFICVKELVKSKKELIFILNVIIGSTIGLILVSIDGAADDSLAKVINSIADAIPGMNYKIFGVYEDGRMNSMLQYPNTFGAYLLAVFYISISLLMYSQKKWLKGIYGSVSFLILLTFIFTYSRGAWLLFPIICLIYLIYLWKIESIIEAFAHFVSIGIVTLVSIPFFYKYLTAGLAARIWLTVLIGGVLTFGITYATSFISGIKKINTRKLKIVFFSTISIFVILAITVSTIAFSIERPVILSHNADEEEVYKSVTTIVDKVEPDTDYILNFDVDYSTQDENKWAFNFVIYSINENNEVTAIKSFTNKDAGKGNQDIDFKTLEDTKALRFTIHNRYIDTSVNISNVKLINNLNQKERNVIFKYKYIPDTIAIRLKSIESYIGSDNLRYILFKDAFKIIKDKFFIGAGGGAWGSLYFMYQSYFYLSNQVHNYFMQFWIETGTIGMIILLLWLVFIFRHVYRYRKRNNDNSDDGNNLLSAGLTAVCISLLAHSIIDFDLTLGAVSLLLWIAVGLIMVLTDNDDRINKGKYKTVEIIVMVVVCIGMLSFVVNMKSASTNAQEGVEYGIEKEYEKSITYFEKAVRQYSLSASYKIDLAKLYNVISLDQDKKQIVDKDKYMEVDKLIKESIKLEPYNPEIYTEATSLCFNRGMIENGLKYLENVTKVQPFKPENYDLEADAYLKLGINYLNNKDYDNAEKYFNKVLEIPDRIKEINKKILKPISVTDKTIEMLERTEFLLNNYKDPESLYIFNRLVLNSYFTDSNLDNIPDSWAISNREYTKNVQISDNILKINGNCAVNLYSRYFILEPKTIYNLSFEAEGNIKEDDNFILRVSSTKGTDTQFNSEKINITQHKNIYNYEIYTSEDLDGEQRLLIIYKGKDASSVNISNIKIYQKYIKE
jgi:O-antigen ligase